MKLTIRGAEPKSGVAVKSAAEREVLPAQAIGESLAAEPRFDPPFPDRIDPFSFPDTAPVADSNSTSITMVAQVEVLGFAYVDEPRVFLKTRDTTKSLKVGDLTDGVEVVAINPPTVDLKMGTLVWTATMFDNTVVARD